jgi:hypothetical protein
MKLYHSHNLNPRVAVAVACHLKSPFRISTRSPGQIERFRSVNPNALVQSLSIKREHYGRPTQSHADYPKYRVRIFGGRTRTRLR